MKKIKLKKNNELKCNQILFCNRSFFLNIKKMNLNFRKMIYKKIEFFNFFKENGFNRECEYKRFTFMSVDDLTLRKKCFKNEKK